MGSPQGTEAEDLIDHQKAISILKEAAFVAEDVVQKATHTAEKLLDDSEERTQRALEGALRQVFGENQDARRFVDVTRIPLICASIVGIHESLKELKDLMKESNDKFVNQDQFFPVRSIVFGIAGILGVASMGAVLKLIFVQ